MDRSRANPDASGFDESDSEGANGCIPDRATVTARLRERVEGHQRMRPSAGNLPFGVVAVDDHLPGGGLPVGALHEIVPASEEDEPAAFGFAVALIARHLAAAAGSADGEALLVVAGDHPLPYGHGLAGLGLDPSRLLLLTVESDADAYRAIEEALRARALSAVAGLVEAGLPLKQSRRLHLAAEDGGPLLLILRPGLANCANVAATRWRIAAARAARDRFGCIERPVWRAQLDRCRNGRLGQWLLEWDHATHRFGLAGALAGHAPETRAERSATVHA